MISNTNKFRQAAIHYQQYGYYTSAPKKTAQYTQYWDEEAHRCLYGWTAEDGDSISGYNYFYLNYSPIYLVREKVIKLGGIDKTIIEKILDFPAFYDNDYDYFNYIDQAENQGKHACVIKKRRAGYSFKAASMMCRNFYLIPGSKSYAIASEAEFLTKDGLLTKAWDLMSWLDTNTAWTKKRQKIDTRMHKRASYVISNDGTMIETGFMSEIMGITLKNDINKARGKAGKLILWEEGGKFPGLRDAWQIARPSVEQGSQVFGLMIAYGTGGGNDTDYAGLKDLFYEPDGYNILGVDNIWDEGSTKKCGFFVPAYANLEGNDQDGNPFMDKDGNTIRNTTINYILSERQRVIDNTSDRNAIDRYVAEHPMNPMEATLQLSGNIFPKKDLSKHLAHIRNSETISNYKQDGGLIFDEGGVVKWHQDKKTYKSLNHYRLEKNDNREGAIVIYEHPIPDPPWGLYIAGCLIPGEQVLTNTGLKNVEDITYDDRLIDKDGEDIKINQLLQYNKEDEDTYTIKLSNTYRTTTFTKEHPIYISSHPLDKQNIVKESLFNFEFKRVSEVKIGEWIKYPNYYFNNDNDYEDDPCAIGEYNEDQWWFQGLWLGDGWCSRNRVYIAFDSSNVTQIQRLKDWAKKYQNKDICIRTRGNSIECSFMSDFWVKYLTENYGKYAYGKSIPEYIKHEKNKIKQHLLLGFLDSDGCVYKDSRGYISLEFVSINLKLLEDFQDILFSLGHIGGLSKLRDEGIYNINDREGKQNKAYHLRLGHNDSINFAQSVNFENRSKLIKIDKDNIFLTRSRPKSGCFLSNDLKYIYFQIKDLKQDKYTGTVYNFETETHTYCTHHITTHNCDPYELHDKSGTDSLGSVFIYKRFNSFETTYDVIVAEYTGRPDTAEDFYDNVRKLLIYYMS